MSEEILRWWGWYWWLYGVDVSKYFKEGEK